MNEIEFKQNATVSFNKKDIKHNYNHNIPLLNFKVKRLHLMEQKQEIYSSNLKSAIRRNKKLVQNQTNMGQEKKVPSKNQDIFVKRERERKLSFKRNTSNNSNQIKDIHLNQPSSSSSSCFTQTMYDISSLQYKSNRRYVKSARPSKQNLTPSLLSSLSASIFYIWLGICLISFSTTQAFSTNSQLTAKTQDTSPTSSSSGAGAAAAAEQPSLASSIVSAIVESSLSKQDKESPLQRNVDSSLSNNVEASQKSVVASLSSAVASAAAAAAVAAAQNTLTGGDGRSLVNSHHRQHQARSPNPLNLALKIADSIPEVPYHILHNMKKIDHAAPFFNVGSVNRVASVGSSKESSHNLLSSAISIEQLFRSPIWKRIADGYGEFTSEFRSLFKPPAATPMKGSMSSTTKLLRDISVPALLMLAASVIPSDWHPVRTRRKSAQPELNSLQNPIGNVANSLIDPMTNSASNSLESLAKFSMPPSQFIKQNDLLSQQAQLFGARAQTPLLAGDINLQMQPSLFSPDANWISQQAALSNTGVVQQQARSEQQVAAQLQQSQQQQQQQQPQIQPQATRRFGEATSGLLNSKPVNTEQQQASRFLSSLTSSLNSPSTPTFKSKSMLPSSGISNANSNAQDNNNNNNNNNDDHHKMINGGFIQERMFAEPRRDTTNDRYKYSLVNLNNDRNSNGAFPEANDEKLSPLSSSSNSKPFLLSAMTQALANMMQVNHKVKLAATAAASQSESGSSFNFNPVADKTITNFKEAFTRRQSSNSNGNLAKLENSSQQQQQQQQQVEQRDLSQFLPQTWRELAKRTMTSVQQQANTQWKSIEGQLTSWVQDKLKSLPAPASGVTTPTTTTTSNPTNSSASPVANIIASVKDTALNILGLTVKGAATNQHSDSSAPGSSSIQTNSDQSSNNKKGKNESNSSSSQPGKLAGVANLIVSSLTRQTPAATSKSTTNVESSVSSSSPSQYPTLTSADSAAMAAGTASTVAGISTQMV